MRRERINIYVLIIFTQCYLLRKAYLCALCVYMPVIKILTDKSCHALIMLGIGFNNICDPTKPVSTKAPTSLILRMVLLEWMVCYGV